MIEIELLLAARHLVGIALEVELDAEMRDELARRARDARALRRLQSLSG